MKLVLLLFLFPSFVFAQKKTYTLADMPFQIDSTTGGMVFRGVVPVEGATADQLYSRAKSFLLKAFTNNTAVIQIDDKASGVLGAKGQRVLPTSMAMLALNDLNQMYYELPVEIRVKDGRYRYELSNIVLVNRNIRVDLDKEIRKNPHAYDNISEKQYKKYMASNPLSDFVNEMKASMAKPDPKDF